MMNSRPKFVSLAELAARSGTNVPCAGNQPLWLDDPHSIWLIERGTVNLFLIEVKDGVEQVAPQFLMSREPGWILPGVAPSAHSDDKTTLHLIAKGSPHTSLQRLPVSALSDIDPAQLAGQIDTWLNSITETLSRFTKPLPRPTDLAASGAMRIAANSILSVQRDAVWISNLAQAPALFLDLVNQSDIVEVCAQHEVALPLTRTSWINVLDDVTLTGTTSHELAARGELMTALASFHAIAMYLEQLNRRLKVVDDVNLEQARTASRRKAEVVARQRLFNIFGQSINREDAAKDGALADALQIIGEREKIHFKIPTRAGHTDTEIKLFDVLTASGVRARRVRLNSEDKWWWNGSGSLLAYRTDDGQPVALVPATFGAYREIDPVTKRSVRLTAARAQALMDEAWVFYRPLTAGCTKPKDLVKIAFQGARADVARLVITGLSYGLIRLAPAFALGIVANHIAAGGSAQTLYVLAATLAGIGLLGSLLHLLQSTTLMRLQMRSTSRIEAAFWDHLMRLPAGILKRYPAGDLANSAMSFQSVRDGFQGVAADGILSILFLLPIFCVIYFYDATLGAIALAFSCASLLFTAVLGLRQISPYRRMISASNKVAGRLFQIISGISKLRMESAEGSAFAIWAKDYREQKHAQIELGALQEHAKAFSSALPFVAAGVLLFAVMAGGREGVLPVGDFLIVYTVFMVFQSAVTRLEESLGAVAALFPAFDQMRPLLEAVPETERQGEPIEYLSGDILFDRVSYSYAADGPMILKDVTIRARAGELIAIAGESGAGKSTLFRLALGVDQPNSGAVYYDGRDLKHLNLKQLRQSIGSVPQSVRLHPQDLWDNVAGHHYDIEADEVWAAMRIAEIEQEVKGMPMGAMTMVGSSDTMLSGGEKQRITIAHSVFRNPRIMLFDEATNWLDNQIQAKVMENLNSLTATRIVIAHRLSTLKNADRIYVLKGGRVAQSGSYKELMEVDGAFKDLVKRQIV